MLEVRGHAGVCARPRVFMLQSSRPGPLVLHEGGRASPPSPGCRSVPGSLKCEDPPPLPSAPTPLCGLVGQRDNNGRRLVPRPRRLRREPEGHSRHHGTRPRSRDGSWALARSHRAGQGPQVTRAGWQIPVEPGSQSHGGAYEGARSHLRRCGAPPPAARHPQGHPGPRTMGSPEFCSVCFPQRAALWL